MGDIADDMIEAEMFHPDLDPADAYAAHMGDLAANADHLVAAELPGNLPKKRPKKMPKGLWEDIKSDRDNGHALRRYQGWWCKQEGYDFPKHLAAKPDLPPETRGRSG